MLQISSYWLPGDELSIDFSPKRNVFEYLQDQKQNRPKSHLKKGLSEWLPARLLDVLCEENLPVGQLSERELLECAKKIHEVSIKPNQTEGYRTAEVTLGGVDTRAISSKTFECLKVKGLYFIGEVLDVTGQLGGYNFQWAWSSGVCCGQVV
jgi:predicted Rossmann fold flavoprotein